MSVFASSELKRRVTFSMIVALSMVLASPIVAAEQKFTVGAAETVKIYPGGREFKARIDTGATTTSINARKINPFTRGGKEWVRFEVVGKRGQVIAMESQVVRTVRIKHFGAPSKRRFVVQIGICLGSHYQDTEATLEDRSRREFPVLIGRRYMAGFMLVDSGREYLVQPNCPGHR